MQFNYGYFDERNEVMHVLDKGMHVQRSGIEMYAWLYGCIKNLFIFKEVGHA